MILAGILNSSDQKITSKVIKNFVEWSNHANNLDLSMMTLLKYQRIVDPKYYSDAFDKIIKNIIKKRDLKALNIAVGVVIQSQDLGYRKNLINLFEVLNSLDSEDNFRLLWTRYSFKGIASFSSTITPVEIDIILENLSVIKEFDYVLDWLFAGENNVGIASRYSNKFINFLYNRFEDAKDSMNTRLNNTFRVLARSENSKNNFSTLYSLFLTEPDQSKNVYWWNISIQLLCLIYNNVLKLKNPDHEFEKNNLKYFKDQILEFLGTEHNKLYFVIGILGHVEEPSLFSDIYIKIFQLYDNPSIIKLALESLTSGVLYCSGFDGFSNFYENLDNLLGQWKESGFITENVKKILNDYSEKFQDKARQEKSRSEDDINLLKAKYGDNII